MSSLREQLAPIGAALRESRAQVLPVSQVTLRLRPGPSGDRFHETVRDILQWMNNRAGQKLPYEAWSLKSFEMADVGAQRTAAVGIVEPRYWAARLDDADKTVPRRTWITEIGIALVEEQAVMFGTRLTCVARGENPPFEPTVPGFVRSVLASGKCELDGEVADGKPRLVESDVDAHSLVQLLERRSRTGDVIVIAHQEDASKPETIVSATRLASRLQGISHVAVVSSAASFALTNLVGKELSVFRQAVRTYRPGFRAWLDEPSRHPLALPSTIVAWPAGGIVGFENQLCSRSITNSVYLPGREERLPSFTTVRQFAATIERDAARRSGASDAEMLKLYEDDNRRLAAEVQEQREMSEQILKMTELDLERANQRADEAVARAMHAGERIRRLEEKLSATTGQRPDIPVAEDLSNFEGWCKEYLAGQVVVTNRAFQGVKKSLFEDPTLLYRALLALRDHYVPMRMHGGLEYQTTYAHALSEIHVEESATGEGVRFEGDEYTVQYQGRRRWLDRHLKAGSSRDPRHCFRLYFFWDDESQVVVVGWLPSHLENRST